MTISKNDISNPKYVRTIKIPNKFVIIKSILSTYSPYASHTALVMKPVSRYTNDMLSKLDNFSSLDFLQKKKDGTGATVKAKDDNYIHILATRISLLLLI